MRDHRPVDRTSPESVATWATEARLLTRDLRLLAEDATLPHRERRQSRAYLRKMICRRLRELDARIDAIDPAACAPANDVPAT